MSMIEYAKLRKRLDDQVRLAYTLNNATKQSKLVNTVNKQESYTFINIILHYKCAYIFINNQYNKLFYNYRHWIRLSHCTNSHRPWSSEPKGEWIIRASTHSIVVRAIGFAMLYDHTLVCTVLTCNKINFCTLSVLFQNWHSIII